MSDRTCVIDNCEKPTSRSLCRMHASRLDRTGTTDPGPQAEGSLAERYERHVIRADGCWSWSGFTNEGGYGQLTRRYAHRVAYELLVGPIPAGMCVMHRCDNPPCTNPEHLVLGTQADNIADAMRKGRLASGECNSGSKLAAVQVVEIRRLCASGSTQRAVAAQFGISQSQVGSIARGKSWRMT